MSSMFTSSASGDLALLLKLAAVKWALQDRLPPPGLMSVC